MRRLVPLLLLISLAAGCGGSKSASSTTTTSAADATSAYVAAGNRVCIRSDKRIFQIGRLSRDPAGWAKTAAAAKTGVREMLQVKPPPAKAAAFKQMVKLGNALALAVQEVHLALKANKIDQAAAAQFAAGQIQDRVHTAARAAGLTFCQQALTNWPA